MRAQDLIYQRSTHSRWRTSLPSSTQRAWCDFLQSWRNATGLWIPLHRRTLCTQPWESGVGKPERAACQGLELRFQCIEKLVKDRVDAIVSRPGRGGETGRLQIQFLGFVDKPSQMAFTVILKRRPVPIGTIVWPIWILGNPILPYQFIPEPGQMQVDASIWAVSRAGVRGQFNPTFDQALEGLSPEHLMDKLRYIPRLTLLKMLRHVVLLEGMPTTCDQCTWRIGDKDPDDWARDYPLQHDLFQLGLFWQKAETKVFCERVVLAVEPQGWGRRPFADQSFGKVFGNLTFTFIAHGQCHQNATVNGGPCLFVSLTFGFERSLAAGRVGCGKTRVGHFGRTSKFDSGCDPFGCLAHHSYPETLMEHVSQLESVVLSKFKSFAPTLIMLMFAVTFEWV